MNIALVDPIAATANITPRTIVRPENPAVARDTRSLRAAKFVELATEFARRGHRTTVVLSDRFLGGRARTIPDGVRVVPVGTVLPFPFHPGLIPATPSLASHPALREADVIQVGEFHQPATFFAALASQALAVPVVAWQETFRRMRFPGSVYQRAYESTAGRFVRVQCRAFVPRTTNAGAYLRFLGIPPDHVGPWIPTGIDTGLFAPRRSGLSPEDFGWSHDAQILLLVARLHAGKGVDLALHVVKWLSRRHPNVRLIVAGSGPEREAMLYLAADLGIADAVRFVDGRSPEEMAELYNLADVVLNTSRMDLLPISLIEAIACGRPCVATDVGAIPDIVVDGRTGRLVREHSVEAIGKAVSSLLADEDLCCALGRLGRVRAEQYFALSTVADKLLEVYGHVAA